MASKHAAKKKSPKKSPRAADLSPPDRSPTERPKGSRVVSGVYPPGSGGVAHPGQGLTPSVIRLVYSQAESGRPAQMFDVFEDVLCRDGGLRSACDARIEAVAGKPWILIPGNELPVSLEAAKACEADLRAGSNFSDAVEHQLTRPLMGCALTEPVWDQKNGGVAPVWFANTPHRRLVFDRETDQPRIITKDQPTKGEPIPTWWWFSACQARKTVRAGLMVPATWWSSLKMRVLRDAEQRSLRFGIPYILGLYGSESDTEELTKLHEAIENFGTSGGAALPDHMKLEIINQGGGETIHGAIAQWCDQEMSRLILGGTLTQGEGSSSGSYAQARVHQSSQFTKTLSDAAHLGVSFANSIGRTYVEWNAHRFPGAAPPVLSVRVTRESDPLTRVQILSILANELGLDLDEDQIREENGARSPVGRKLVGTKRPAIKEPAAANPAETPPE